MSPLALSRFWPAEFLPARRGQESAGRRTAQRAIPTTARRRKRPPGRARSPAKSQLVAVAPWWPSAKTQWQFGVDERRIGRDIALRCPRWRFPVFGQRNFCRPAGDRKARADGRRSAPSLPRCDGGNGHRDERAPRQCPSWWPCANTGQWQFGVDKRRIGRDIALRCPRWRFPVFGQRNFCRPAGDRKARADGRRSAPSLPRCDGGNGHRDGRAPRQCPNWWPWRHGGRPQGPKGSLGWTNGAKGG